VEKSFDAVKKPGEIRSGGVFTEIVEAPQNPFLQKDCQDTGTGKQD
jgi:hypothetical protein